MPSPPFSTPSLLLASWILYGERNEFLGYRNGKFWFDDSENTIQFLISGYHGVDPRVNLHKFEKCRASLLTERRKDGYGFDARSHRGQ
jgi:hypothetical protein